MAFNAGFVANPVYPFIITGYGIATAALLILPTIGKDILSSTKSLSE
ncbi:hypothetical protein VCHC46B1_0271 [Vibrio cholerae HC-46B1]|nr:hypothetical protein VCHC46B1_0271 [Vibrio cholerae HC-46B1]